MDDSLYRQVAAEDDVAFWSWQFGDHGFFIAMGMVTDAKLAGTPYTIREYGFLVEQAWFNFRATYMNNPSQALPYLPDLLLNTQRYKQTILARLRAGEWLGFVYPDFIDHVLDELNRFIKRQGASPSATALSFWTDIVEEHLAFDAHNLDPKEDAKWSTVSLRAALKAPNAGIEAITAATIFETTLAASVDAKTVQSLITPRLIAHQLREDKRALWELHHV